MALTEDLTFMLTDTGVVLNSAVLQPFVDIHKVTGLDSAPYRTTERDWEGNDGGFMDAEFEKGRNVVLDGTVYSDTGSIEDYLDDLKANFAPTTTLQNFYFKAPGVVERLLFVKPLGCRYDWDELRRTGQASIQFSMFAEDPRIYDSELLSASVPLGATVYTGFGFDLGFDFGFGGVSSTTDQVTLLIGGNRPTPPIFVISGPVTNPRILNDVTGAELRFNITLDTLDTLTIDTKYKTVRLNGTANRRSALVAPDWYFLEPGSNTLRYRAESSSASTLSISYRNAWR